MMTRSTGTLLLYYENTRAFVSPFDGVTTYATTQQRAKREAVFLIEQVTLPTKETKFPGYDTCRHYRPRYDFSEEWLTYVR
jgi:hypothetical protein